MRVYRNRLYAEAEIGAARAVLIAMAVSPLLVRTRELVLN